MPAPSPPAGMGAPGRALWRAVTSVWELRPDESELLAAACRTADELDRLQLALEEVPAVTQGSKGQPVPHPLFGEVRAHRAALARLLDGLGLDEDQVDETSGRQGAARALARARWGVRGSRGA